MVAEMLTLRFGVIRLGDQGVFLSFLHIKITKLLNE